GLFRRAKDFNFAARFTSYSLCFGNDGLVWLVTRRRGDADMRSAARAGHEKRVAHVVTVADISKLQAAQSAEALFKGKEIRQRLTGMKTIRERIDHGNVCVLGQLLERVLIENARDYALHPPFKISCDIADRLTLTEARGRVIQKDR